MAIDASLSPASDSAILSRSIRPEADDLPVAGAEAFLNIRFGQRDLDRIHELVAGHREDRLTTDEFGELESYRRISYLLDLMHAKARLALKTHEPHD